MNRTFALLSILLAMGFFVSADYNLVWSDEFNGNSLDTSKWNYEINCDGGGNNELQCYTNHESNVRVQDGFLYVTAKPENYNGKQYTSGRINTKGHAAWKYGRFDIRAKLPRGDYLWPALWLLPRDSVYGPWAASGEIDIMEARGQLPKQTQSTVHHGGSWPNNVYTGSGPVDFSFDFTADFHIFSLIWDADSMQFLVDGKVFHTQNLDRGFYSGKGKNPYTANRQPFDQPFFFIINLAIGGGFFGAQSNALSVATAQKWPSPSLVVDYIRVYQENGTPINPQPPAVPSTVSNKASTSANTHTSQKSPAQSTSNNNNNNNNNGACSGKCGGESCCNDQKMGPVCYNAINYGCPNDSNGKQSLCGKGLGVCSAVCFDASHYKCVNGAIHQL